MKIVAHTGLIFALGLAALLSGCATSSQSTRYAATMQPARNFEVVETSAKRPLTDREMDQLESAVKAYLDKEGQTEPGDHYVKVYLTPETEGAASEWVVVRYTRYSAGRLTYLTSYSAVPTPYYTYGYYPFSYDGWGSFGLEYYDYSSPYNRGYRRPPPYRPNHNYDRDRHDGHRNDNDDHNRHRRYDGRNDRDHLKPGELPRPDRTRWDRSNPGNNFNRPDSRPENPARGDPYPHRNENPQWRGRNFDGDRGDRGSRNLVNPPSQPASTASSLSQPERSYSPPPSYDAGRVPMSRADAGDSGSRQASPREAQARQRLE